VYAEREVGAPTRPGRHTTEGELAFVLDIVTHEGDWDRQLFDVFAETFQPLPNDTARSQADVVEH
jgi:hypothetical protein